MAITTTELEVTSDERWQALKDYHASEMRRFSGICDGLGTEQTIAAAIAAAIAVSVHMAHKRTLTKMTELEAGR